MQPLSFGDPIRLGPYRIAGVLGEGGMGKVYVGHDSSGRLAAVKVLRPELAHDHNLTQRFLREARTAQAVASGGVARVVAAQTEGGRPWIATEYLSGPTLEQAVTGHGPLDEAGVRALAAALASTLQEIHAAGLIHRDLKPANIVLTSSGPRVIDFGIARPEHGLTLTTTGQAPATPGYGAPEQILGQRVGPSADVFSLGAVLVYAASGRQAYEGAHVAAVQYEVVHGSPALHAVPEALRPLIAPCLAKDPAHRPPLSSVIQLSAPPRGADRLWKKGVLGTQIKEHETRTSRLSTLAGTAVAEAGPSRRFFLTSLAAGGAVLALGGGATAWWLNRGPGLPEAADAAPAKPLSAGEYEPGTLPKPLWGPLKAAAPSASMLLPVRDVVMMAGSSEGLAAHRVTDGRLKWTLPEVSPSTGFLRLTDEQFVAADADGNVRCYDASTGEPQWSVPAKAEKLLATASEAKLVFVLTKDGELAAVDAQAHEVRWTVGAPAEVTVDQAAVAVAGSGRLVVCTADGYYFALDTADGDEAWKLGGHAGTALTPAVEGRFVYVGGKSLLALDLESGDEVWSASSHSLSPEQDGWGSPVISGGSLVAIDDGRLYRVDRTSGSEDGFIAWPDGTLPSRTPPVLQGSTLWIVEGGTSSGASAFGNRPGSQTDGELMWTYGPESEGDWHMAAAGNRVFLLNKGSVVALPVF
ncbi:PQQ-binding-like beta-propeller repeat protein [Streptomyces sp. QL37]|uniref:serine/threonine-protein kinase n=1 Tax=Streptomyces sp. QL37 TaxID=2093747 RepID=UPI000CF217FD|nr:serine/threonine-protein kinase [Streptomyces sp. QL37]PPQ58413.1 serine/threonine protein kinase [Streptomyces sp. QL37]